MGHMASAESGVVAHHTSHGYTIPSEKTGYVPVARGVRVAGQCGAPLLARTSDIARTGEGARQPPSEGPW